MIHKILLFNLSDPSKESLICDKTMELLARVPGAENVTFRRAVEQGEIQYRYLITVDFESMQAHDEYLVHESHVSFSKEYFRPNISELLIQFFE
ncbi:Dabb family protein [Alicyclobacillus tolerans]|uniref:Dabb family protein n=1 Tax=Alicyclobacillus tolerans TaxID=90970 RepID=UPI001F3039CF|nr:Dabb family protein [Alicyclobacillus tolerans]MCF8567400.1 Dabb family protein [Alicyclobacillus tolerans]